MPVLIDASAVLLRSAGIKSYAWQWVNALRAISPAGEIQAFPLLDDLGPLLHERSALPNWATYPRLALLYAVNQSWLPALDWATAGCDVFHASNQVRRAPRRPLITATLHDITTHVMPEFHTGANIRADETFFANVVRRAAGLIAISEHTKYDAVRHLDLQPQRIEVIYNGVAESYFTARPAPAARTGIAKPYVLFVGAIEPRKNVDRLLDAWALLRRDLRERYELVIAGSTGWHAGATRARLESLEAGITWLGYVPEEDLPGLTAGATVFAYPSLYEGFGIPVAQAMAASVPVLTSNVSCLPEVVSDGGLCVDPRSPSDIAAGITRLLESPGLRAELGANGHQIASVRYRWQENARRSLAFFRRVLGR